MHFPIELNVGDILINEGTNYYEILEINEFAILTKNIETQLTVKFSYEYVAKYMTISKNKRYSVWENGYPANNHYCEVKEEGDWRISEYGSFEKAVQYAEAWCGKKISDIKPDCKWEYETEDEIGDFITNVLQIKTEYR